MTTIDSQPASLIRFLDLPRQRILAGTRIGDVLSARVDAVVAENRVILEFKGVSITALTRVPLRAGQFLNLQIVGADGEITLKPVSPQQAREARVSSRVLTPPDDSRAVARFIETFAKSSVHDLPQNGFPKIREAAQKIARFVREFGVDAAKVTETGGGLERVLARLGVKVAPRSSPALQQAPPQARPKPSGGQSPPSEQTSARGSSVDTGSRQRVPTDTGATRTDSAKPEGAQPTGDSRPSPAPAKGEGPRTDLQTREPASEAPTETRRPGGTRADVPARRAATATEPTKTPIEMARPVQSKSEASVRAAQEIPVGRRSPRSGGRPAAAKENAGENPNSAKPDRQNAIDAKPPERASTSRTDAHATQPDTTRPGGPVRTNARGRVGRSASTDTMNVLRPADEPGVETVRNLRDAPKALESLQREVAGAIRSEGAKMLDRHPGVSPQDIEALLATVKQLGQHVERMGLLHHVSGEQKPLYLEIPFWAQGEVHTMKIRLHDRRKSREEAGEGRPMRMDLFFDLAEMGRVRADVRYVKGGLTVRFFAESRDVVEMFQRDLAELDETLAAEGVRVDALRVEHRIAADPQLEAIGDLVTLSARDPLSLKG